MSTQQPTLFPTSADLLMDVVEKVRSAELLDAQEMKLLEAAVKKATAKPRKRAAQVTNNAKSAQWGRVVGHWKKQMARALGEEVHPDNRDLSKLKEIFEQRAKGDADKMCRLIDGYFEWHDHAKRMWEEGKRPSLSPFKLAEHFPRVVEFMVEQRKRLTQEQRILEQRRMYERQAKEVSVPPRLTAELPAEGPNAAAIHDFTKTLGKMKSLGAQS